MGVDNLLADNMLAEYNQDRVVFSSLIYKNIMEEKELLSNCWNICIEELKQCAHIVVDVGRLNDTLIALRKRLTELGVDMKTLDE